MGAVLRGIGLRKRLIDRCVHCSEREGFDPETDWVRVMEAVAL